MKFSNTILCLLIIFSAGPTLRAADTVYFYGANHRPLQSMENAKFMQRIRDKGNKRIIIKFFSRENTDWQLKETQKIRQLNAHEQSIRTKDSPVFARGMHRSYELKNSLFEFRETIAEKLIRTGTASKLIPLILEGEVIEYYPNGQVKSRSAYRNNQLQSNKNWLKDGSEYIDNIFYSVDKIPEYSMGNPFFRHHMLAGIKASKYDITQVNETIILGWVITEDGKLTGVQKVAGKSVLLSNILIKLVESLEGDWSPAIIDGRPVRYFMTIPFNFLDQSRNFQSLELSNGILMWD